MKKVIFLLFILSLAVVSVYADDLTVKGKVYQDYEVTGYSEDGIIISHASGTATISPGYWPKDKEKDIAKFKVKIEKLKQQQIEKANTVKAEAVKKANALPANAQCLIFKILLVGDKVLLGEINSTSWLDDSEISIDDKVKLVLNNLGSEGKIKYQKNLNDFKSYQKQFTSTASRDEIQSYFQDMAKTGNNVEKQALTQLIKDNDKQIS